MIRPYVGGDEYRDFKNLIGRTFLSGSRIFAETEKPRLSAKSHPVGGRAFNKTKNKGTQHGNQSSPWF